MYLQGPHESTRPRMWEYDASSTAIADGNFRIKRFNQLINLVDTITFNTFIHADTLEQ